jgi:hypothetical protein|tara:strand:- start:1103 stop:1297 length:195 start_codon:yes stop_codon:yes gene_type:complete
MDNATRIAELEALVESGNTETEKMLLAKIDQLMVERAEQADRINELTEQRDYWRGELHILQEQP